MLNFASFVPRFFIFAQNLTIFDSSIKIVPKTEAPKCLAQSGPINRCLLYLQNDWMTSGDVDGH